jgi:hypothetical protein
MMVEFQRRARDKVRPVYKSTTTRYLEGPPFLVAMISYSSTIIHEADDTRLEILPGKRLTILLYQHLPCYT